MNQTQNPGTLRTDELARNAAYNTIRLAHVDATGPHGDGQTDCERMARYVVDEHTVTWERDINSAGVAVRRYVLRGEWEVDPEPRDGRVPCGPVTPTLRALDVVRYLDRRDGDREWTVQHVTPAPDWSDQGPVVSMTSTGADEVAEHQYTRADELELVQRTLRAGEPLRIDDAVPGVMYRMPTGNGVVVDDPDQDDLTPAQHRRVADELGNARREGYAEALRRVWDAMVGVGAVGLDREATRVACRQIERTAAALGVTL